MIRLLPAILLLIPLALCAQNRKGDPTKRMQMMVDRYDTNKDGVLTKDEFRGRGEHWRRMDANRDGKVDAADFATICQQRSGGNRFSSDNCPAVGESVGDFTLKLLDSEKMVRLSEQYADKPVVLTFGSYTCPPFRRALEGMEEKISIPEHLNFGARSEAAAMCQGALELSMPVLVDGMDNAMESRFDAWPNRCIVIDKGGVITYKGQRGPNGTMPNQVVAAIKQLGN